MTSLKNFNAEVLHIIKHSTDSSINDSNLKFKYMVLEHMRNTYPKIKNIDIIDIEVYKMQDIKRMRFNYNVRLSPKFYKEMEQHYPEYLI